MKAKSVFGRAIGALLAMFLVATAAQAGDPVMSLHPLHTELDAVMEPAFEGVWLYENNTVQLRVTKSEGNYVLKLSSAEDKNELWFEVYLVRLGTTVFADIRQLGDTDLFLLSPHVFAKIQVDGDELRFDFLNDSFVRNALESGRTDVAHEWMESTLVLTASAGDLQNFVASCAFDDEAFGDIVSFTRMKEPPQKPGA